MEQAKGPERQESMKQRDRIWREYAAISPKGYNNSSAKVDGVLVCPCGCEYTHLTLKSPVFFGSGEGPSWVRGECLVIEGYCENGCRLHIVIGSHKGGTYIDVRKVGTHDPESI